MGVDRYYVVRGSQNSRRRYDGFTGGSHVRAIHIYGQRNDSYRSRSALESVVTTESENYTIGHRFEATERDTRESSTGEVSKSARGGLRTLDLRMSQVRGSAESSRDTEASKGETAPNL